MQNINWIQVLAGGIDGIKQLEALIPELQKDLEAAKQQPWFAAVVAKWPALQNITDAEVVALGKLSAFLQKFDKLLNLFPAPAQG